MKKFWKKVDISPNAMKVSKQLDVEVCVHIAGDFLVTYTGYEIEYQ